MNRKQSTRLVLRLLVVLLVVLLGAYTRLRAVELLPIDYDEDDYLLAGQHYGAALAAGDWQEISEYEYNLEHPPLAKLLYGAVLSRLPASPELTPRPSSTPPASSLPLHQFLAARLTSAALGTLTVLGLALLNPLAGFFLAFHSFTIKYTSQIMLEALPAYTSLLAVLFYARSRLARGDTQAASTSPRLLDGWLVLSALALGLTAASKYLYAVAGIAILAHALWRQLQEREGPPRRVSAWLPALAAWGLLALLFFIAANPYLWPNPIERLQASLLFNVEYSQSEQVSSAAFPTWQPLAWIFQSVSWHPGVFVLPMDVLAAFLAMFGLKRLWQKQPLYIFWLAAALIFLFLWPTKWPQYILVLTAPLSLAAAEGFFAVIWEPFAGWVRSLGRKPARKADPLAARRSWKIGLASLPWMLPGLLVLALITLYPLLFQGAMALTDFRATQIKDGLTGGVWREVWEGLSGQAEPVEVQPFERSFTRVKEVRYAGISLLRQLFFGFGNEILVFEIVWTVLSVALQLALGLGVALLLHQRGILLRRFWLALFILPWAIPEFIGALIWARLVEPTYGWLTLAASFSETPGFLPSRILTSWQQQPDYALILLLIAGTWYGFPFMMMASSAALKFIPVEVYDAAALDGASRWQVFRHITWPMALPLLIPAIIIRAIYAFNQFYLFYVLFLPHPLITFATLSFFLFDTNSSFGGQFAVSAAINILTVAVLVVFLLFFNRWSKATEGVSYA